MLLGPLLRLAGTQRYPRYPRYPCAAALRKSQVFERKFKNLNFAHFRICHGSLTIKSVLQNSKFRKSVSVRRLLGEKRDL